MWANANVMAALPHIGGVAPSVQRRKVWLTPITGEPCSSNSKTQNLLKLAGVPQTMDRCQPLVDLKFTILWGHLEEILLLNKFFFRLSIHALFAKI